MERSSKSLLIRISVWSVLLLYLLCDFYFSGPLKKAALGIYSESYYGEKCAEVYGTPIYTTQVNRRVNEDLWKLGRSRDEVSKQEMKMLRWNALRDLLDQHLLRVKVRANAEKIPVSDTEINAELVDFQKSFRTKEALSDALKKQGISGLKEMRYRVAARIQQEKYLSAQIADYIKVSDEECQQCYQDNKDKLIMPERRRVRHIFLSHLDHPNGEAQGILSKHLEKIVNKKMKFSDAALNLSEDLNSKNKGGDLGWISRQRIAEDFSKPVFAAQLSKPFIIETKIGWHIVEVTDFLEQEDLTYEQIKNELRLSISALRKQEALEQYRKQLREMNKDYVKIFRNFLE